GFSGSITIGSTAKIEEFAASERTSSGFCCAPATPRKISNANRAMLHFATLPLLIRQRAIISKRVFAERRIDRASQTLGPLIRHIKRSDGHTCEAGMGPNNSVDE